MDNPPITDKDWDELEHGSFIYSDDECSKCKKTCKPKCLYLDENDYDNELISFEDHEEEIITINLNNKLNDDKINKIEFKD